MKLKNRAVVGSVLTGLAAVALIIEARKRKTWMATTEMPSMSVDRGELESSILMLTKSVKRISKQEEARQALPVLQLALERASQILDEVSQASPRRAQTIVSDVSQTFANAKERWRQIMWYAPETLWPQLAVVRRKLVARKQVVERRLRA